jgi:hypothetical protein
MASILQCLQRVSVVIPFARSDGQIKSEAHVQSFPLFGAVSFGRNPDATAFRANAAPSGIKEPQAILW